MGRLTSGRVHNYYLLCSVLETGRDVVRGFVHKMDPGCDLVCVAAAVLVAKEKAIWIDADFFFVAECDVITSNLDKAEPRHKSDDFVRE